MSILTREGFRAMRETAEEALRRSSIAVNVLVCAGTACHVRKSGPIYDAIYEYLGLSGKRKTSDDGMFTLETVACLGACGLAPVMTVDGEVHAKMTPTSALELLERIRKEEAAQ